MLYLRSFRYDPPDPPVDGYPFTVPFLADFREQAFTTPVTFLVGENGSGKSTFLESLAVAADLPVAGGAGVRQDPTLDPVRPLARRLRLVWNRRVRKGFFLRAEDFFGYVKRLAQTRADLEREMRESDERHKDRSEYARGLARMPYAGELAAMRNQYQRDLGTVSHGESYITFFQSRFIPGGLYLLDEPEAPLSPVRQLGFLALLREMVAQDAQFIIATHSPIILAFPEATILSFDDGAVGSMPYDSLEHVNLTRDFLNNPESFLRHL